MSESLAEAANAAAGLPYEDNRRRLIMNLQSGLGYVLRVDDVCSVTSRTLESPDCMLFLANIRL